MAWATSMTAVPRCRRQPARTGSPSGPLTTVVRFGPPSTARVPSPPSAIGTSSQSHPQRAAARLDRGGHLRRGGGPTELVGRSHHSHRRSLAARSTRFRVAPVADPPLVVVSNRGPLSFTPGPDGRLRARRGAGGLVSGLAPLVIGTDTTWIAAALSPGDREAAAERRDRGRGLPRPHARARSRGPAPGLRRGVQRHPLVRAPRAVRRSPASRPSVPTGGTPGAPTDGSTRPSPRR